ncbi:ribonuclease H family protein [Helicovermis profundi]|uniref:ribonuclease H n=1 Tax=Helicovermis profundi TaxID=3065157 RepID=A0AAU9E0J1_9FIRM|nr:hypothetical protein HLPR_00590 [Clostridia bacterium S502]
MKIVNIYTDGGCSNNQSDINTGGWGSVLEYNGKTKEIYGGEKNTTNNRMEIFAVLMALKELKTTDLIINIYSDSSYVINCLKEKWYIKWQKNGWINSQKKKVENKDLWEPLISEIQNFNNINFYRAKGHLNLSKNSELEKWHAKLKKINGNDFNYDLFIKVTKMNNLADELANKGIDENR